MAIIRARQVEKIKQMVKDHTMYEMNNDDMIAVELGILQMAWNLTELGIAGIKKILAESKLDEHIDWCGNYNGNLNRIHIEFHE